MSFKFLGADSGPVPVPGSRVSVFETIQTTQFTNENPDSTKFVQIWDPSSSVMPEPDITHVMLTGRLPQMDKTGSPANYPGSCGAAFGYARLLKGNIPQKLYAWKGWYDNYPYAYTDPYHTSGFSDTPSNAFRAGAYQIPVPAKQGVFWRRSFPAPDAVAGKHGDWAVTFSGGTGAWVYNQSPTELTFATGYGGAGSNGSIFGPGYNANGNYGGGTGGNATATARGPAATSMHPDVLPEWAQITKAFVTASDPTNPGLGAAGDATFGPLPTNLYLYAASVPFAIDESLLVLPSGIAIPNNAPGANDLTITLTIFNQYFTF